MTEKERETLRIILSLRIEAKSMLSMISDLQNSGKGNYNEEINKWLDKIHYYDALEEEIMKKKY